MDFYYIIAEKGYQLSEDDDKPVAALANSQIGLLADRLSQLFKVQKQLELAVRTYITAYYTNGKTEYISLKARPSLLLAPERIKAKFGANVDLDGFAATFLEGEEENRVWLGEDGAVENRGDSGLKVKRLLEVMTAALNEGAEQVEPCASWPLMGGRALAIQLARYLTDASHFGQVLDLNQAEIGWFFDELGQAVYFEDGASANGEQLILPLLASQGYFALRFHWREQRMVLEQRWYPWEEKADCRAIKALIDDFVQKVGDYSEKSSQN